MQCPPLSVAKYRNSKGSTSVILKLWLQQTVTTTLFMPMQELQGKHRIVVCLSTRQLYRPLECGELLAKPVPLPGSAIFVTVADDAFPLAQYMMKQSPNLLQEPLITDFPVQDESQRIHLVLWQLVQKHPTDTAVVLACVHTYTITEEATKHITVPLALMIQKTETQES